MSIRVPHDAAPSLAERLRTPFANGLAIALAVHVLARTIGLLILTLIGSNTGHDDVFDRLRAWDGGWYIRIADDGYADRLDLSNVDDQSTGTLAFFPVYPLLMRVVSMLTGMSAAGSGILISELAAAAASVGLYVLVRRLYGTTPAILVVLLWSAQPMSVVLSMVYTEALFTAFVVWCFVALQREAWLAAGVLGMLAGLTRPTGVGVGLAVAVYIGWRWWLRRPRSIGWQPVVAALMALGGTPLWWLIGGLRVGRLDGWFAVQAEFWGSQWDWFATTTRLTWEILTQQKHYDGDGGIILAICLLMLAVSVVLLVICVNQRMWLPLVVYAAALLVLTIGSAGYLNSKPRFLLPIFPLLIPIAVALSKARLSTQILVGALAVIASGWFGAYMLDVWKYAI